MHIQMEPEWWHASFILLGFGWGSLFKKIGLGVAGAFTGGAAWVPLIADIAGDVVGGVMQHRAAGQAGDALRGGAERAQGYEREAQRLHSPYYKAGVSQLGTLGELAGLTGADIHKRAIMDPSYDFRFQEGQRALDRSAAAKGTLMTGGHIKNTIRYGQDYASTEYGKAYDRAAGAVEAQFGRASSLAGAGQQAAGDIGTSIGRMAGWETDAATATADEAIQKGNAWAQGIGAVADTIGGAFAGRNRGSSYSNPPIGETLQETA